MLELARKMIAALSETERDTLVRLMADDNIAYHVRAAIREARSMAIIDDLIEAQTTPHAPSCMCHFCTHE